MPLLPWTVAISSAALRIAVSNRMTSFSRISGSVILHHFLSTSMVLIPWAAALVSKMQRTRSKPLTSEDVVQV